MSWASIDARLLVIFEDSILRIGAFYPTTSATGSFAGGW